MKKWRIREIIAGQLRILSSLFTEETTIRIIIPISFKLCKDDVACVRIRANSEIHSVLENWQKAPLARMLIVENIKSFAEYQRFTLRQSFVHMCEGQAKMEDEFKNEFMPLFCKLGEDRVVNVRICLAKVLRNLYESNSPQLKQQDMQLVILKLFNDPSHDVRVQIQHLAGIVKSPTKAKEKFDLEAENFNKVNKLKAKVGQQSVTNKPVTTKQHPPVDLQEDIVENPAPDSPTKMKNSANDESVDQLGVEPNKEDMDLLNDKGAVVVESSITNSQETEIVVDLLNEELPKRNLEDVDLLNDESPTKPQKKNSIMELVNTDGGSIELLAEENDKDLIDLSPSKNKVEIDQFDENANNNVVNDVNSNTKDSEKLEVDILSNSPVNSPSKSPVNEKEIDLLNNIDLVANIEQNKADIDIFGTEDTTAEKDIDNFFG